MGRALRIFCMPVMISQMSRPVPVEAAMALELSNTLPPPMGRMACAPMFTAVSTASRALDNRGLGCTPLTVSCLMPASSSRAMTFSCRLEAYTDFPPVSTRTLEMLARCSSGAILGTDPRLKITFVGEA